MQYMLAIYGDERAGESMPREQMTEMINAYMTYGQALRDAKVLVASNRLRPTSAATTVRVADGKTQVIDGPFAETKEQLGGYYLIDVPDLDAALGRALPRGASRHHRGAADLGDVTDAASAISRPRVALTWRRGLYENHF